MQKTFLTAEWRKLVIVNYSVDPAILGPYLPCKTELDFWKDKCYVSLVGFRFNNTKLKGLSIPFHRDFEEINLRFYVRYKDGTQWKRGVTFIKEIVPKPALTLVANSLYGERYMTLPTKHRLTIDKEFIDLSYEWKHKGEWDMIGVRAESSPLEIAAEKPKFCSIQFAETNFYFMAYERIGLPSWVRKVIVTTKILAGGIPAAECICLTGGQSLYVVCR